MKKIIVVVLLGTSVSLHAQNKHQLTLSLQQALTLGIQNRYDLKANLYNISLAKNRISKNKKAWIPDIHAEGNLKYNSQLRPTIIPEGIFGSTKAQMIAMGSKNVSTFGLSLNQPVFKPGINTDIKIANARLDLNKEKIRGNKIDIKNDIATAYLNVLLKKLQFKIAKEEENRYKEYKMLAEGKYKNGALIENDYLRAKLDHENAKVKTATSKQEYQLAKDYLKYQINVPLNVKIVLSDSISTISFGRTDPANNGLTDQRTEIKQLNLKQKENVLRLKRTRQNALPSVSIVGYYAQLFQNENFNYGKPKWWAPESYVGLKFTIPITANFTNKNIIREYELKGQQLKMNLKQEKSTISYQIKKAETDLHNAGINMQSAKKNYQLAQTIYHNQQQQFAIGVFHYSDLLDTEKSLNNAEQNYIRNVYDYLMAKLQYEKAIGEL